MKSSMKLTEIASKFNVSKPTVNNKIKKMFGMTLTEWRKQNGRN